MGKKLETLVLSKSKIKELQGQYKQERDRRIAERIQCIILKSFTQNTQCSTF